MPQTVKLSAFLVANQLDIKGIKSFLDIKPLADTSSELFYSFAGGKYQCYFNYGVVVFAGYYEDEMKWAIKAVAAYQKNPATHCLRDDHELRQEGDKELAFEFDEVVLDRLDEKVIRITMVNLAQSVVLDYYHDVSENLLTEVKGFATQL